MEDFLHSYDNEQRSCDKLLWEISKLLLQHGKKLHDFGLPTPSSLADLEPNEISLSPEEEERLGKELYLKANNDQRLAIDKILDNILTSTVQNNKLFFLDGPGKQKNIRPNAELG